MYVFQYTQTQDELTQDEFSSASRHRQQWLGLGRSSVPGDAGQSKTQLAANTRAQQVATPAGILAVVVVTGPLPASVLALSMPLLLLHNG